MSHHGCPERLSSRSKSYVEDGSGQTTMEVLVETLTGTAFEMTVSPSDTIFAIKSKIFRVEGIPVAQQHLVYRLQELPDSMSLKELRIGAGARLRLVLSMRGGPISTRRLPPPPATEQHYRDIKRLLDTTREETEDWGGAGCKMTVLVFREGDKVKMLHVMGNDDGTYSPLTHKYSSSLKSLAEDTSGEGVLCGGKDNEVTMNKMVDLRRRMEALTVTRTRPHAAEKPEVIQKTRSEETLSVPSLLDEGSRTYSFYSEAEDMFAPLYNRNYTRHDYECSFTDRYTLLPLIGSRTDSNQSVNDHLVESDRMKFPDSLAGNILVKSSRDEEGAGLLDDGVCLDGGIEECHIRQDSPQMAAKNMTAIPAAEYSPMVGASSAGWLVRGFGSHSHLPPSPSPSPPPTLPLPPLPPLPAPLSASTFHLRQPPPSTSRNPPLSDAHFSSSTSDLEKLRILPALSRHKNREHLHLSDDRLDVAHPPKSLEVGSERRQRRIKKRAEMENARALFRLDSSMDSINVTEDDFPVELERTEPKVPVIPKKIRIRCGFCRKRLTIATVHTCRCGAEFCAPHRYAEVHGCAYDYKADAQQYLQRANPLVSAPKLPKI